MDPNKLLKDKAGNTFDFSDKGILYYFIEEGIAYLSLEVIYRFDGKLYYAQAAAEGCPLRPGFWEVAESSIDHILHLLNCRVIGYSQYEKSIAVPGVIQCLKKIGYDFSIMTYALTIKQEDKLFRYRVYNTATDYSIVEGLSEVPILAFQKSMDYMRLLSEPWNTSECTGSHDWMFSENNYYSVFV